MVEAEKHNPNTSERPQQLHERADRSWDELPRVVSQSPEQLGNWSADPQLSPELSAMNYYCALHGMSLFYATETVLKDGRSWFYRRLSSVNKYLPHFQGVLHTDLDVLVANYSVNVLNFLDDRFDLKIE